MIQSATDLRNIYRVLTHCPRYHVGPVWANYAGLSLARMGWSNLKFQLRPRYRSREIEDIVGDADRCWEAWRKYPGIVLAGPGRRGKVGSVSTTDLRLSSGTIADLILGGVLPPEPPRRHCDIVIGKGEALTTP